MSGGASKRTQMEEIEVEVVPYVVESDGGLAVNASALVDHFYYTVQGPCPESSADDQIAISSPEKENSEAVQHTESSPKILQPPFDHPYCRISSVSGQDNNQPKNTGLAYSRAVANSLQKKPELAMLRCPFCPAILVTELRFYNHLASRHPTQPQTEAIEVEVERYRSLPQPVAIVPNVFIPRPPRILEVASSLHCGMCPAILVTKRRLRQHLRTMHGINCGPVRSSSD